MNQQPPQKKKNTGLIIGIVVAIGFVGLMGLVCCGAAVYLGIGAVDDMELSYYPECEYLPDSNECDQCCDDQGHNGYVHGPFLNEDDKTCGCTM